MIDWKKTGGRAARAASFLLLASIGLTCRDRNLTGPGLPTRAHLGVAPSFQVVEGTPRIVLHRVRAEVFTHPAGSLVLDTTGYFDPGAQTLRMDIPVIMQGTTAVFRVRLSAYTEAGDLVFQASDTVSAVPEGTAVPPVELPMTYVGADTAVALLAVAPRDTIVSVGDSVSFRAVARRSDQSIVPALVGWTSSDTSAIGINLNTGRAFVKRAFTNVWIRGRTLNLTADSTQISATAPVASVVVAPNPASVAKGATVQLTATVRDAAGNPLPTRPVSWSSSNTSVATVSSTGLVTGVNAGGPVTITASSGGVNGTASLTVTQPPVATVILAPDTTVFVGDSYSLRVELRDASGAVLTGRTITYQTTTPAIATVNTSGVVTALTPGTSGVVASSEGVNDTVFVTVVQRPVSHVQVDPADTTMAVRDSFQLRVTLHAANGSVLTGRTITYTSSNPSIATVSATGMVSSVAIGGPVTITAASEGVNGTATVTVADRPVAQVIFAPDTTIFVNQSFNTRVELRDATGTVLTGRLVTYASVSPSIATIDTAGLVRGVGAGSTGVIATSEGRSDTIAVIVNSAADSVRVAPDSVRLTSLNDSIQLSAQVYEGGAPAGGTFTWAIRNPSVASVSSTGIVVALSNGLTYVVATDSATGLKDSAVVNVQQQVSTVTVTPSSRSIYLGTTFQLSASAVDGRGNAMPAGTTITWSSLNTAVAQVDTNGRVSAVGIGSAQIRATAGGVVGTSTITVLSAIQRIAVTPDTLTLAALGWTQTYNAVAYDTLDAPMSGISFTWTSTNPSVALLDSLQPTSARATAAANGISSIRATAQGVVGSATLKVQQALASIELTPSAISVAPGGAVQLSARGKDANNRYISGGSFVWASNNTGVATVTQSGVVTGVAVGAADITATSGAIVSNASTVTVTNSVPPVISFGRDTLTVGRGGSTSIPIFLSIPNASPTTVVLSALDTVAYFSVAKVTFPANATSINVTLNGRNAGTTRVIATDSAAYYTPDTAVVAVTATMRLQHSSIYINQTDQYASQVLLSDPSPVGGTYVTFAYSVQGIASVSPDPAFIPAGQLAADIVVRGVGAGSTTITPVAQGVNGTATSFTAAAAVLSLNTAQRIIGLGQYQTGDWVQVPQYSSYEIPIVFTSLDTTIARVPGTLKIPAGGYYAYYNTDALGLGSTYLIASAGGPNGALWRPDTTRIIVTTPQVDVCCNTTLNTTSPPQAFTVYTEDSLGTAHYRMSSLVVNLSSSDTTVIKVDTLATVNAGQYYTQTARMYPVSGGSAYIRVTAGGHRSDSMLVSVTAPKMSLSFTTLRLGARQQFGATDHYVQVPNTVTSPLTVRVTSADTGRVVVDTLLTIPTGSYYAYFTIKGLQPTTGSIPVIATAVGYTPDTGYVTVTTPRVTASGGGSNINNFSGPRSITVYLTDSLGTGHWSMDTVRVTLASSDTNVIRLDSSTVTILPGAYYNNLARAYIVGEGTARLYVTGPAGFINDTSVTYSVIRPKITWSIFTNRIGLRQERGVNDYYFQVPDTRSDSLPVTISQKHPERIRLTGIDTATFIRGTYYRYFGYQALAFGTDTLIISAPGYNPDTAFIVVTTPKFTTNGIPGTATTTDAPRTVTVYSTDSIGNAHYSMDTITIMAVSSDTNVIRLDSTYFHLRKGDYYTQTPRYRYIGPGTASITFSDSAGVYQPVTTNTVTVTGPTLRFSSSTQRLGMRQHTSPVYDRYVYTENNVTDTLWVRLTSTDPRVASVPDSAAILPGYYYAYFPIVAHDTLGTIQIQATALGHNPATPMTVQVTRPRFEINTHTGPYTTTPEQTITVYATDDQGNGHYVNENVVVTLTSSDPAVASPESVTVTIDSGQYYTQDSRMRYSAVGTVRLTASDERAVFYKYDPGFQDIAVSMPPLSISYAYPVGIGQYYEPYVSVPNNTTSPLLVTLSHAGTARASYPDTQYIPSGTYYRYFRVAGVSLGVDTMVVTAPGHLPDTAYITVGTGTLNLSGLPASMTLNQSASVNLIVQAQDGGSRNVVDSTVFTLTLTNVTAYSDAALTQSITSVTVPAANYYQTFYVKATGTGTGTVTVTRANYATLNSTTNITAAAPPLRAAGTEEESP